MSDRHRIPSWRLGEGRSLRILLVGLALCLLPASARGGPPERSVGFVVEIAGDWVVTSQNHLLARGASLPGGAHVRSRNPRDSKSRIRIALLDGRSLSLACSKAGACESGLDLPDSLNEHEPFAERLLRAAARLWHRPRQYESVISRGFWLKEAVVPIAPQGLDLRNAIGGSPKPRQEIAMRPALREGQTARSIVRLSLDHRTRIATREDDGAFVAGLYELTPVPVEDGAADLPWPDSAWILATEPSNLERRVRDLEQAEEFLSGTTDDARTSRPFLRAYLELLSQPSVAAASGASEETRPAGEAR